MNGALKSEQVERVMRLVDRGDFCPYEPYLDSPIPIGFNATISAPHMHAYALELALPHLPPDARVLDVGSGSGYLAVCFAQLVKPGGMAVGLEHIEGLVDQSIRNTRRSHSDLLDSGHLRFICGDGPQGYAPHAPYDVIHVGASGPSVPPALLDQLAPGGLLIMPVGSEFEQTIRTITKDQQGKLQEQQMWPVRYVPLTSKQAQLQ